MKEYKYLSAQQREHFLEHGWVRIPNAIPKEHVELFSSNVWIRLGYDPEDKSTWKQEKVHMPRHRQIPTKDFAPIAWGAMCELLGGEDRVATHIDIAYTSGDSLICNFGSEYWENHDISPRDFDNWHVDGDWFTHFLDSPEQGLVVIQLYNDIIPRAGPTWIVEDGLSYVCKWLHDHPHGDDTKSLCRDPETGVPVDEIKACERFVELTGNAGDVFLCHPFMPHSASKNHLRIPRFITNPPVSLKEPFNYNRTNPEDYSLVELKTLQSLGVSSLPDWKITGERLGFTPRTRAGKDALIKSELARMKAHAEKTGGVVESMHLKSEVVV
ncbi:hypothetical protein BOTBODRAFT_121296 [Botryobasidium botryosum FD-172 SS1]|uniref:Uncharacterized protein n=1 Tax=Botryobasidium botryosum (strain FD-172 SS1) TaxID=930990 RepID=A0A067M4Q4_BOTB1|nr:hypothetical protein BOTBODRAFT_121296 [Botryobasidium botryosum FD-172 SS1]